MYLSSKNRAAEILLAIIHCNNCCSVFSLQFLPPWEMHGTNHIWTMTEVGRHPHRSPCPTTRFNQGQLEPAAQFSVQTPFEYLQDGDSLTSLGNLCQCLVTLQREGHPVILRAEVATMKLCSCQASDLRHLSNTVRSFTPLQLQPSPSCSLHPLRRTFICSPSHTFWNFPFSVLPFFYPTIHLEPAPFPTHAWRHFRYLVNLNLSKFLFCCSQRCRGGLWYQIFFISIQRNIILKAQYQYLSGCF